MFGIKLSRTARTLVVFFGAVAAFSLGILMMFISTQGLNGYVNVPSTTATLLGVIGTVLAVSIPTAIFRRYSYEEEELERRKVQFAQLSKDHSELVREYIDNLDPVIKEKRVFGLMRIVPEMNFSELFRNLNADEELYWLDTYSPTWKGFADDIGDALRKGAHLKFLVIDPKSATLPLRAAEIGTHFQQEEFLREVEAFSNGLLAIAKGVGPGTLEVRYYSDLLGSPIYLVKKEGQPIYAYSSMYLSKATGIKFPHFKWSLGDQPVIRYFQEYVENKWTRNAATRSG